MGMEYLTWFLVLAEAKPLELVGTGAVGTATAGAVLLWIVRAVRKAKVKAHLHGDLSVGGNGNGDDAAKAVPAGDPYSAANCRALHARLDGDIDDLRQSGNATRKEVSELRRETNIAFTSVNKKLDLLVLRIPDARNRGDQGVPS
jgi:hypothetical protein